MQVVHVINNLAAGGAEKLLYELCLGQKKEGLQVTIVTLNSLNDVYTNHLQQSGLQVINLGQKKYSFFFIFKLRQVLKNLKADIIHSHLFPTQYYVALASWRLGVRTVTTEHSSDNFRHQHLIFYPVERWVYQRYDRIVVISDGVEQVYKQYLPSISRKIIKIENGIDLVKFQNKTLSKEYLNLAANNFVITMIARFSDQKNHVLLIKALAQLPIFLHLVLVGDGPLINKAKKLVSELDLNERVHFLGFRPDIPEIIAASDVVVLSSFWEGFGLSIVEGMASGKAVIASDVSGVNNIVKNAGLLFEVNDLSQLVNHLVKLLDKNYYQKIAANCLLRAQKYDINVTIKNYIQLYAELLEKSYIC